MIWGKKQRGNLAYIQKRSDTEQQARKRQQHEDNLRVVNRIADRLDSTQTQEQADDDKRALREKVVIGLLAATIFVGTAGDVIFYFTMRYAREAAAEAHTDNVSALAQAKAANDATNQRARETLIESARAWVGAVGANFAAEPVIGKPIEIAVQYQNSGHSPAVGFVYAIEPFGVTVDEEHNGVGHQKFMRYIAACRDAERLPWEGGGIVYPISTGLGGGYALNSKTTDSFVDDAMIKGDTYIVVQGCFRYRTFDVPKHDYFCFYYQQGLSKIQNLNICASGQDAD